MIKAIITIKDKKNIYRDIGGDYRHVVKGSTHRAIMNRCKIIGGDRDYRVEFWTEATFYRDTKPYDVVFKENHQ